MTGKSVGWTRTRQGCRQRSPGISVCESNTPDFHRELSGTMVQGEANHVGMEHPLGRILNQQISKRSGIVSMVEESLRVFPGQTVGSEGVIWIQTELVQFGVNISPKSAVADLQPDSSDLPGSLTGKTHAWHQQVHTPLLESHRLHTGIGDQQGTAFSISKPNGQLRTSFNLVHGDPGGRKAKREVPYGFLNQCPNLATRHANHCTRRS